MSGSVGTPATKLIHTTNNTNNNTTAQPNQAKKSGRRTLTNSPAASVQLAERVHLRAMLSSTISATGGEFHTRLIFFRFELRKARGCMPCPRQSRTSAAD